MRAQLRRLAVFVALALAQNANAADAEDPKPSKAELRDTAATLATAKRIAESVQTTIAAANTMMGKPHDAVHANVFFALLQKETWFVYFGWLEPDGSKFTPAYVLSSPRGKPAETAVVDPKNAPADVLGYARAIASARDFAAKVTHNSHVDPVLMPEKDGISVYVLQGGTRPGTLLLGGDFLDHYDRTGTKLRSRLQFHKAVIEVPQSDPKHPEAKAVGSYHTHIIDDGPTATDIAAALLHPSLTPMFVIGRSGKAFRVDESGNVHVEPKLSAAPGSVIPQSQPADVHPAANVPPSVPTDVPAAAPTDVPPAK